jgi:hypothetical protein
MSGVDASRALGRCKMPIGYQLLQLDSGHFIWRREESDEESSIHWSKWRVYQWAHADYKNRIGRAQ